MVSTPRRPPLRASLWAMVWLSALGAAGCTTPATKSDVATPDAVTGASPYPSPLNDPEQVLRVFPTEARALVAAGQADLVCAYWSAAKCAAAAIEGAQPITAYVERLDQVPRERIIILYCA